MLSNQELANKGALTNQATHTLTEDMERGVLNITYRDRNPEDEVRCAPSQTTDVG